MTKAILVAIVAAMSIGSATAQTMDKGSNGQMTKQDAPGTTGAMGNSSANGVATDPGAVQAQQKGSAKASPGTVGAAPGADTPSQTPKH